MDRGERGAYRVDEKTVAKDFASITALHNDSGTLRAPEEDVYARDVDMPQATGFFTRYGPEPYESRPTFTMPGR